jgi:mRNA-degrading endonuclease toxin of MazEF toxin-antitoxin module
MDLYVHLIFWRIIMKFGEVCRFNFPNRNGKEIYGVHYAVVLTDKTKEDNTLLVAPITSKKSNKKYRGGITIDNTKYQTNPTYDKSFVYIRKIQEIDFKRCTKERVLKINQDGTPALTKDGEESYSWKEKVIFELDETDQKILKEKIKEIFDL